MLNQLDNLGDWNPQFLREIKGRLKVFPVLVTSGISLLVQGLLFLIQLREYPTEKYAIMGEYCSLAKDYNSKKVILDQAVQKFQQQVYLFSSKANYDAEKLNLAKQQLSSTKLEQKRIDDIMYGGKHFCPPNKIDYADWWRDHWEYIFLSLSVIFIFTLLVAGTYQLINNLAQEERRGTLNFIRLSPQSEGSILIGKMLGVPILVYLLVGLAIPFHIFTGKAANIAFSHIFSFYIVLGASCFFFFSAALLFALSTRFLGGFQAWLGSGAVLFFLFILFQVSYSNPSLNHAAAWFRMLSPLDMTGYLFTNLFRWSRYNEKVSDFQFFFFPVGQTLIGFLLIHLANFGLWTYWVWQGLQRRFRNPNAPIINKIQSYWLVISLQVVLWGFTLQYSENYSYPYSSYPNPKVNSYFDLNYQVQQNLPIIIIFNMLLLMGLMVILSPQRQEIQDWARYRHVNTSNRKTWWRNSLLGDLLFGNKSISVAAIALSVTIMCLPIAVWIILSPSLNYHQSDSIKVLINEIGRFKALLGIALFITMTIIYSTIFQRMLLMKTTKRYVWAVGTVGAIMYVPPFILGMLNVSTVEAPVLWLLSSFPWAGLEHASSLVVCLGLLAEISVLTFLNMRLTHQIRLAGESATQALLANSAKVNN